MDVNYPCSVFKEEFRRLLDEHITTELTKFPEEEKKDFKDALNYLNKAIFSSYGSKKKRKRPPEEHLPSEDLDIELLNEVFKLENEIQEKIKRINEIKKKLGGNINIKDIQENIYSQYDNAINLIKSSKLENKESDTELKLFENEAKLAKMMEENVNTCNNIIKDISSIKEKSSENFKKSQRLQKVAQMLDKIKDSEINSLLQTEKKEEDKKDFNSFLYDL